MGLASYTPERHEVVLKGGSFHVEGLSLEAVSWLVQYHLPDLEALFALFQNAEVVDEKSLRPLFMSLVTEAPGFVANVIALAAGEPDHAKTAAKLPAPVQVDVLLAIGDLTFSDVGLKKSLETIAALLTKMKPEVTKLMEKKAA